MKHIGIIKVITGIILAGDLFIQILSKETWWFMQNINFIFHEAGHVLFIFFGETLNILGGSLLEILIPSLVTLHFVQTKQFFAAAFSSWWLGIAFLSVSIYTSDARARTLPLITGDIDSHDWYTLLLKYNLLEYDKLFSYFFVMGGLLSVMLIVYFLSKDADIKDQLV